MANAHATGQGPLLSRRTVLALAACSGLVTLAGCRDDNSNPGTASSSGAAITSTSGSEAPAVAAAVSKVGAAERQLITAYDDAIAAHPDLAAALAPIRANHATHLAGLLGTSTSSKSADAASTAPSATLPTSLASTSPSPADTVKALAALERAAAGERLRDMPASAPGLSRLIASIGACEASHGPVLDVVEAALRAKVASSSAGAAR